MEEITDAFCINKDKPEMHCNGTCHLKKQLIQTDNSTPLESEQSLYINEIQLFSSRDIIKITVPERTKTLHHTFFEESYSFLQGLDIFHPPKA